jgi:hypothetical protein
MARICMDKARWEVVCVSIEWNAGRDPDRLRRSRPTLLSVHPRPLVTLVPGEAWQKGRRQKKGRRQTPICFPLMWIRMMAV